MENQLFLHARPCVKDTRGRFVPTGVMGCKLEMHPNRSAHYLFSLAVRWPRIKKGDHAALTTLTVEAFDL